MGDRLPFTELENIDLEAARKRLDKAIAARNTAEREVHAARHAYEKLLGRGRPAAYVKTTQPGEHMDVRFG